jgi:hypothetical protein
VLAVGRNTQLLAVTRRISNLSQNSGSVAVRSVRNSLFIDATWTRCLPPAPEPSLCCATNHEYRSVPITARLPSQQPILTNALMPRALKTRRQHWAKNDVSRANRQYSAPGRRIEE